MIRCLWMGFPPLVVLIDGGCPMCRRTARVLGAVDWLDRLTFVDGTDAATRHRWAPGLDEAAVLEEMFVVQPSGARDAGFAGYLQIAKAVPVLWPMRLGVLPGIRQAGDAAYRWIAARRRRDGRCRDEVCTPQRPLAAKSKVV